ERVDEDPEEGPESDDIDAEVDDTDDEGDSEEFEDDTDEGDDPDVQTFTVKVDGEEIEVTLEEALAGYQRQADYTRKTQALSQERERYAAFDALEEALQVDPQGTLTKLARLYGVELAGNEDSQVEDPLEDLDPA